MADIGGQQNGNLANRNGDNGSSGVAAFSPKVRGFIFASQVIRGTAVIAGVFYGFFYREWVPTSLQTNIVYAILAYLLIEQGVVKAAEWVAIIRAAKGQQEKWDGKERRWRQHCPHCHKPIYSET